MSGKAVLRAKVLASYRSLLRQIKVMPATTVDKNVAEARLIFS